MLPDEKILHAKILIVDDDHLNIRILEKILKEAGYFQILSTTQGQETIKIYNDFQPDLLILDLHMPQMDGFQVMTQLSLKETGDYLPILVITADEEEKVRFNALQSGAKDFLNKPFEKVEVLLRSRNLIEVRMLYNQIRNHNVSLEQQIKEQIKEIEHSRIDVIHRLALAAEFRDTDTGKHIVRMSRYAACLAKALGKTPAECELILTTSPLHDVGKIAIPDHILLKPGKLEPHEFEVMKTHTTIGAKMLTASESAFLKLAETIALTHHEKWDGTGYPQGLKEGNIPFVGRICCVCDVFDALVSDRPYKKAWIVEDAIAEIQKGKGKHFDPKVVEAFMDIRAQIIRIKEQDS